MQSAIQMMSCRFKGMTLTLNGPSWNAMRGHSQVNLVVPVCKCPMASPINRYMLMRTASYTSQQSVTSGGPPATRLRRITRPHEPTASVDTDQLTQIANLKPLNLDIDVAVPQQPQKNPLLRDRIETQSDDADRKEPFTGCDTVVGRMSTAVGDMREQYASRLLSSAHRSVEANPSTWHAAVMYLAALPLGCAMAYEFMSDRERQRRQRVSELRQNIDTGMGEEMSEDHNAQRGGAEAASTSTTHGDGNLVVAEDSGDCVDPHTSLVDHSDPIERDARLITSSILIYCSQLLAFMVMTDVGLSSSAFLMTFGDMGKRVQLFRQLSNLSLLVATYIASGFGVSYRESAGVLMCVTAIFSAMNLTLAKLRYYPLWLFYHRATPLLVVWFGVGYVLLFSPAFVREPSTICAGMASGGGGTVF